MQMRWSFSLVCRSKIPTVENQQGSAAGMPTGERECPQNRGDAGSVYELSVEVVRDEEGPPTVGEINDIFRQGGTQAHLLGQNPQQGKLR